VTAPGAPPTYATADQARAYVAAVLARPSLPEGRRARVYLIVPPSLLKSPAWAKLSPAIASRLDPADTIVHRGLFTPGPSTAADRAAVIAARCDGALVVPRRLGAAPGPFSYVVGIAAETEAATLAGLGVPVLVFGPSGLFAWPDCRSAPSEVPAPPSAPVALELPAVPPRGARMLPTLAVCYRALGVTPWTERADRPKARRPQLGPLPADRRTIRPTRPRPCDPARLNQGEVHD
jgi:hypothetical protein